MKTRAFLLLLIVLAFAICACREDATGDGLVKDRVLEKNPEAKGFLCVDVEALIPKGESLEGKTCKENKAVVNGHSDKCLAEKDCNKAARLAEFNAAAEQLCADWCAQKSCDYDYAKRPDCDSYFCVASKLCRQNCDQPFLDHCSIQQSKPNYSCQCKDRVSG